MKKKIKDQLDQQLITAINKLKPVIDMNKNYEYFEK